MIDTNEIIKEVKANLAKLAGCKRHVFIALPTGKMFPKHRCKNCDGEVSCTDAQWYNKGLEHAKQLDLSEY